MCIFHYFQSLTTHVHELNKSDPFWLVLGFIIKLSEQRQNFIHIQIIFQQFNLMHVDLVATNNTTRKASYFKRSWRWAFVKKGRKWKTERWKWQMKTNLKNMTCRWNLKVFESTDWVSNRILKHITSEHVLIIIAIL